MKALNHPTPKRSIVFSTSALVKTLDRGALKRNQLQGEIDTTDQYVSKERKKRFKRTGISKAHSSVALLGNVPFGGWLMFLKLLMKPCFCLSDDISI